MAFSFTYKKIFDPAGYWRIWSRPKKRDQFLRYATVIGAATAYGFVIAASGVFPPEDDTLSPFIYFGKNRFLPVSAVFFCILYVLAWSVDENPVGNRRLIVVVGLLFACTFVPLTYWDGDGSWGTSVIFIPYILLVVAIASWQLRTLTFVDSDHAA